MNTRAPLPDELRMKLRPLKTDQHLWDEATQAAMRATRKRKRLVTTSAWVREAIREKLDREAGGRKS